MKVVLTSHIGNNSDLLPYIFEMYVPDNSIIADVTYGKGVFWNNINKSRYKIFESDLQTGIDFRYLPYENSIFDCLILDPPYMHGGETIKASINDCYKNKNTSHESVIRLYTGGILEASRVLKKKAILLVKCQDEIESGKQQLSHLEIIQILEILGFSIEDLFILTQKTIPAMRESYQKTARKNHSYMIVAKFRK